MTYEEMKDAIDGLSAYDAGACDSGIKNETLRQQVKDELLAMSPSDRHRRLSLILRDLSLTDEALDQGYGWKDARELCEWFDDQFGVG